MFTINKPEIPVPMEFNNTILFKSGMSLVLSQNLQLMGENTTEAEFKVIAVRDGQRCSEVVSKTFLISNRPTCPN
jgi:hypothetical protein